jgi:hypothetical protein
MGERPIAKATKPKTIPLNLPMIIQKFPFFKLPLSSVN